MENINLLCKIIKYRTLRTIDIAKTGHIGACCSSNELMCVLYFSGYLQFDIANPNIQTDHMYCVEVILVHSGTIYLHTWDG